MFAELSGFTDAYGSTSALRYSMPPSVPPVQLAAKGVSQETRIAVSAISGGSVTAGGVGAGIDGAGAGVESDPPPQAASNTKGAAKKGPPQGAVIGGVIGMFRQSLRTEVHSDSAFASTETINSLAGYGHAKDHPEKV